MLCLLLIACTSQLYAQKIWSQVTLDRASAYVGQPVEVRITVYTSTWFTSGIDPGNIKVNGAYTIYFRPVSRSFQQGGQNYAGVELIYNVFPYRNEDVIFPSLDIEVESPPEGDFKGEKRTLKTAEKRIRIKPIPPNFSDEQWLVATGLTVTDNWSGNRQKVKVGDVLERSIARTAYGTVGQLVPPIAWDSLPGISMYPARSNVENHETKTAISATRTETMRYLFEKEGEITLPEMVFSWYNPFQEKLYKRTLEAITIDVQPNPDLGMLASIKDSLQAQQQAQSAEMEAEAQPFTILGLSPKKFISLVLLAIVAIFCLVWLIRKIIRIIQKRRAQYRNSEAYYFQKFKTAARKNEWKGIIQTLYRWIDELKLTEPSAHYFAKLYGTQSLLAEVDRLEKQADEGNGRTHINMKEWQKARKNFNRKAPNTNPEKLTEWINPG